MSSRSAQIVGGPTREHAHVDAYYNALAVIDGFQHKISNGEAYVVSFFDNNVDAAASVPFVLSTAAAKETHISLVASVSSAMILRIYKNPTVSGAVTSTLGQNRNQSTGGSPGSTPKTAASVTGGTLLQTVFLPGGFGKGASGFSWEPYSRWVMGASTDFVLEFENISGEKDMVISATLDLHEEPI